MTKTLLTLLVLSSQLSLAATPENEESKVSTSLPEVTQKANQEEVIENPTLKTLLGSLNPWSLYSSFTYRGGSIEDPLGAERPNIQNAAEAPGLANMSGNLGFKYRLTKQSNISLQTGLYSTTPFHSSIDTDNARNQRDFDENGQQLDADDPTLSYFRTYNLGALQNVSFVKYQYVTRGSYRDFGLRSGVAFSQATAIKIHPAAYIAATLTYESYQYDKTSTTIQGRAMSLTPYQTLQTLRANLSTELYLRRNLSVRFISDVMSYYQMRGESDIEDRVLQQTLAMTYFFNRDISLAPNVRFILGELRPEQTNMGLTFNVNL